MTERSDLITTLAGHRMFTTFARLIKTSGADRAFVTGVDFTIFAPTNDAFCKVPDVRMNALLQEQDQVTLRSVLWYHIVPERLLAESLGAKRRVTTITGIEVAFTDGGDGLKVNDSIVQVRNIETANGVIQGLDSLLDYDTDIFRVGPVSPPIRMKRAAAPRELFVPRLNTGRSTAYG